MKEKIEALITALKQGDEKTTDELMKYCDQVYYTEGVLEWFEGGVVYSSSEFGTSRVSRPELILRFALNEMFPVNKAYLMQSDEDRKKERELLKFIYKKTNKSIETGVAEDGWSLEQLIELLEGIETE